MYVDVHTFHNIHVYSHVDIVHIHMDIVTFVMDWEPEMGLKPGFNGYPLSRQLEYKVIIHDYSCVCT